MISSTFGDDLHELNGYVIKKDADRIGILNQDIQILSRHIAETFINQLQETAGYPNLFDVEQLVLSESWVDDSVSPNDELSYSIALDAYQFSSADYINVLIDDKVTLYLKNQLLDWYQKEGKQTIIKKLETMDYSIVQ